MGNSQRVSQDDFIANANKMHMTMEEFVDDIQKAQQMAMDKEIKEINAQIQANSGGATFADVVQRAADIYSELSGETLTPAVTPIDEYVALKARKDHHKGILDGIDERMDELEAQISEDFINRGQQSATLGGYCVYLNREVLPKKKAETPEIIAMMKYVGGEWDELVKENYNTNSLRGLINELPKGEDGMPILPEKIAEVIGVVEKFSIKARKA